jgi:hypothetical protein
MSSKSIDGGMRLEGERGERLAGKNENNWDN